MTVNSGILRSPRPGYTVHINTGKSLLGNSTVSLLIAQSHYRCRFLQGIDSLGHMCSNTCWRLEEAIKWLKKKSRGNSGWHAAMALPGFYQVPGSLRVSWMGRGKTSRALQSLSVSLQLNSLLSKEQNWRFLVMFCIFKWFLTNPCPLKVFKIEWSQIKWKAGQVQNGVIVTWVWVYFPSLFPTIESIWKIQGAPAFLTVLCRGKSSSLSSLKLWTLWSTKDCTWNPLKRRSGQKSGGHI